LYPKWNIYAHVTVGSKKLKCSGGQPTCSRCLRENITCIYSLQKQMGRPKKRQRAGDEEGEDLMIGDGPIDLNGNPVTLATQGTERPTGPTEAVFASTNIVPNMNMATFDSAFALDETLQPWTALSNMNWTVPDEQTYDSHAPDLTRDNSSEESPPMLNLPAELLNIPQTMQQNHHTPSGQTNLPQPTDRMPTCACLSTLYLTLSNLATMDPSFSFPTALHPIREAMSTASQVISCPICPTRFITGLQNVQLLNALLMSLAERFSRILTSISNEAEALALYNTSAPPTEQKSKPFRLADLSAPGHMHTGGLGCAAAFSLSFTPAEWRSMAKKVVRAEVHGPPDGSDCCPFLLGLITTMEGRQGRWHNNMPCLEDYPKDKEGNPVLAAGLAAGGHGVGNGHGEGEHLCLKMLAGTRRMVDGFDWD
jgi:hypothetical protein